MDPDVLSRGVGLALSGAALWMLYFDLKDRRQPEPRRRLFATFLLGAGSALLAVGAFHGLDLLGIPRSGYGQTQDTAILCFLVIGPLEEACKAVPLLLVVYRFAEFDELVDGVIYAAALAIGFAALEMVLYIPHSTLPEQIGRAFAGPLTHSIFASLWGYGFARARLMETTLRGRIAWSTLPFLAGASAHGLYDFVLLAWGATLIASGVALVLWILLLIIIRHALHPIGDSSLGGSSENPRIRQRA